MRIHALCALGALTAGCSGTPDGGSPPDGAEPGDIDAPVDCAPVGNPLDLAELRRGVEYLASDELGGRASDTPGDAATRTYIADRFRCAGLVAGDAAGRYQQAFVAPDGTRAANIVGYVPGSDPALASEVVIVGAHHDHLGTEGGAIYNGANDNASGTVALIALARSIAAQPPSRTVGFVAFGYEEHDGNCEGSEYFAANAPAALAMDRVTYMVDLDMVGTYALAGELTVYGTTPGTRGRAVVDSLAPSQAGLALVHAGNADADDSDFQAFADRGIGYVYFETWDDACYHQPCDDAARLDYPGLVQVTALARDVVLALATD